MDESFASCVSEMSVSMDPEDNNAFQLDDFDAEGKDRQVQKPLSRYLLFIAVSCTS